MSKRGRRPQNRARGSGSKLSDVQQQIAEVRTDKSGLRKMVAEMMMAWQVLVLLLVIDL